MVKWPLPLLLSIIFIVNGCSSSPTMIPTGLPTNMGLPASTITPTMTLTPTITFTPTLTITSTPPPPLPTVEDPAGYVRKLLADNNGCELPCILGITPGKTTINQAIQFLDSFGCSGTLHDNFRHIPIYEITSLCKNPPGAMMLANEDGIVTHIHFGISGKVDFYSLKNIIKRLGKPTKIWVANQSGLAENLTYAGNSTELYYEDKGILIIYDDLSSLSGNLYHFCPSSDTGTISIYTADETKKLAYYDMPGPIPGGIGAGKTIDVSLGMTIDEFYERVQGSVEPCFDTPAEIWQP